MAELLQVPFHNSGSAVQEKRSRGRVTTTPKSAGFDPKMLCGTNHTWLGSDTVFTSVAAT